ncbi:hypothetical protein [Marininema halotolerans]|uniref:Uncharacterized protein n=1 Tax=Marininema halotolerans TaxID=1155944 RepID=A0A1I6SGX7_9BACL|nr:hypothetical protein [Marininema halotolerans]SFS76232.1 hypothetical protein SAMN05444972_10784 [Marininema halotolerans]
MTIDVETVPPLWGFRTVGAGNVKKAQRVRAWAWSAPYQAGTIGLGATQAGAPLGPGTYHTNYTVNNPTPRPIAIEITINRAGSPLDVRSNQLRRKQVKRAQAEQRFDLVLPAGQTYAFSADPAGVIVRNTRPNAKQEPAGFQRGSVVIYQPNAQPSFPNLKVTVTYTRTTANT